MTTSLARTLSRLGATLLAVSIGAEASAQTARLNGEGFEFRRKLSAVDNQFCNVPTFVLPDFAELASSTEDAANNSVIVIDAGTLKNDRPYARFLMAHECCHHTLGHTRLTSLRVGKVGPQPFYYIRPMLKAMELDADACAVRMLKRLHDFAAIDSGKEKMLQFGKSETGAYYPTGIERAANIAATAAKE